MRLLEDKFWSLVEKTDTCWLWKGPRKGGYGRFSMGKKEYRIPAHRFAMYGGDYQPEGVVICHTCDNPLCVNPKHLYEGTRGSNLKDWWDRQATTEHRYNLKVSLWPERGTDEHKRRCEKHRAAALNRNTKNARTRKKLESG